MPGLREREYGKENEIDQGVDTDPREEGHFPFFRLFHLLWFYKTKVSRIGPEEKGRRVGRLGKKVGLVAGSVLGGREAYDILEVFAKGGGIGKRELIGDGGDGEIGVF